MANDLAWITTYVANAVTFDGSTTYLLRSSALSGAVASSVGTVSFWVKLFVTGVAYSGVFQMENGIMSINVASNDRYNFGAFNCSFVHQFVSQSGFHADTKWHHILASWNISTNTILMFVDGINDTPNTTWFGTDLACWSSASSIVGGSTPPAAASFHGSLSDLYINTAEFVDLTVTSNVSKFISAGKPVYLGATGQLPTGNSPTVFLTGNASVFANNVGTGGAYAVNGLLGNDPYGP